MNRTGIKSFDYTLTGKSRRDLERDLGGCDIIHVNGGNDFYLLLQAKKSGFDQFIKRQIKQGVIYTGSSAGSAIAAPDLAIACYWDQDHQYRKMLPDTKGFNLVDFIIFPHWASPIFRNNYLNLGKLTPAYKKGYKIILLNDNQYMEVTNGDYKIVDITKDSAAPHS